MVDRGLISEFERSLSSQEGQVWFPVGASLWAPKLGYSCQLCFNHVSASSLRCQQNELNRIQHHKKFVLHCIVTDHT